MKARMRSEIWSYFTRCTETRKKAKCNYCERVMSIAGGSTGNLARHLKKKHPTVLLKRNCLNTILIKQPSSPEALGNNAYSSAIPKPSTPTAATSMETDHLPVHRTHSYLKNVIKVIKPIPLPENQLIDQQLVKMICKQFHPFSLVEDTEFKKFVHLLCPEYNIPSKKTVINTILPMICEQTKIKVTEKLEKTKAVALTTDCWSSINNECFCAITVHYLDENTELCSNLLECFQISNEHISINISDCLLSAVKKWNIHCKISAVVTDDEPEMVDAVALNSWTHLTCFANTINLIVQSGFSEIKDIVMKVKRIVQYFKQNHEAGDKLRQTQKQMNYLDVKLKEDVISKWYSTYDMFERFLKNKEPVMSTLTSLEVDQNYHITSTDWILIEHAVNILSVFYEVTLEISTEKTVSLSKISILINIMAERTKLYLQTKTLPIEILNLGNNLIENLNEKLMDRENNDIISQTILLDPRFKKQGFIDEIKFKDAYSAILNNIAANSSNIQLEEKSQKNTELSRSSSSLWDEFDANIEKLTVKKNPTSETILELDKYLEEPLLLRSCDPLIWWNERKTIYKQLYHLAIQRLCIPATSVPSETIFSKAGISLNEKRNRLSTSKLSEILFLNSNLE